MGFSWTKSCVNTSTNDCRMNAAHCEYCEYCVSKCAQAGLFVCLNSLDSCLFNYRWACSVRVLVKLETLKAAVGTPPVAPSSWSSLRRHRLWLSWQRNIPRVSRPAQAPPAGSPVLLPWHSMVGELHSQLPFQRSSGVFLVLNSSACDCLSLMWI